MFYRKGNDKGGALIEPAVCGNGTVVLFYDLFYDGEADARALVGSTAVQALKDAEDPVTVSIIEADAVVFDGDLYTRPCTRQLLMLRYGHAAYFYNGRYIFIAKL